MQELVGIWPQISDFNFPRLLVWVPWGLLYNKFAETPQDPRPWRHGQMLCRDCNRRKGAK